MAWLQSEKDISRIRNLRRLEDRRVAFAQRLLSEGLRFEQALMVQSGGGFEGIALGQGELYLLEGPAPGDDEGEFRCQRIDGARAAFEPFICEGEGMGGMLGMGKKGGTGYRLVLDWGNAHREISFVSALQGILDVCEGDTFPLVNTCHNKGEYNFVWDFPIISRTDMDRIVRRWQGML